VGVLVTSGGGGATATAATVATVG